MKMKHNNKGFSLVELIVVIAIMAILGGVGTVGYTKYIEQTNKKADMALVGNVMRAIDTASHVEIPNMDTVNQLSTSGNGIPVPVAMVLLGQKEFGVEGSNEYVKVIVPQEGANEDMVNNIFTATFGQNYQDTLKLKYDGWTDIVVPTFYTSAGELIGSVKTLTGLISNNTVRRTINRIKPGYLNSSMNGMSDVEIFSEISKATVATVDQETFVRMWKDVEGNGGSDCAFGLNTGGTECYTAARRAYNEAFANYVKTKGGTHPTKKYNRKGNLDSIEESAASHAEYIAGSGMEVSVPLVGDLCVSDTFCWNMYNSDETGYNMLGKKGSLDDRIQNCEVCKSLYEEYKSSAELEENGIAYYKTMVTVAESCDSLIDQNNGNSRAVWDTYNNYVDELSNSYSQILSETSDNSVILITVYVENGLFKCEVSPTEANPRNK